jgi:hypothetical protein
MSRKLNNRTAGLRNFVEKALMKVREKDLAGAELVLVDLWNDIGCAYVCKEPKRVTPSPVPNYDPKKDGDYNAWLIAHNID